MYFLGSENYIVLTFWDQSDKKDHIYLINWDCNISGKVSITLCCRSDLPLADVEIDNKYVKKFLDIMSMLQIFWYRRKQEI